MQQFIPFEDDWDALENLRPESLVPYHVGVPCRHDMAPVEHPTGPMFPAKASASPAAAPSNSTT
jgi:hypothetical protein